jgi:hypothetical protein
MPNLPHWGRGNFDAVEQWLAHLFDHHDGRAPSSEKDPPPKRSGATRKRHPLEGIDIEN